MSTQYTFEAELSIIGINPFVYIPTSILEKLFEEAQNSKGPIPVCGTINSLPYRQTLIKFKGEWRLYVNTKMLDKSPQRIGENIQVSISIDKQDRKEPMNPLLQMELARDNEAKIKFNLLTPSLQKEINRYLNNIKTKDILHKNVSLAIGFIKGKNRFIGRNPLSSPN